MKKILFTLSAMAGGTNPVTMRVVVNFDELHHPNGDVKEEEFNRVDESLIRAAMDSAQKVGLYNLTNIVINASYFEI